MENSSESPAGGGPVVVCSVREGELAATLRAVREAPVGCALVEIRGDDLAPGDVVRAVREAGRPVLATLRDPAAGGGWRHGARSRRETLEAALDAGAAWIDVEWDGPLREMASGPRARRVVLSHHDAPCSEADLAPVYEAMAATPAARLKLVPHAAAPAALGAVRRLLERARHEGRALACFAQGRAGAASRLLAPSWGSWATYGAARPGAETAPGQFPAGELLELHGVLAIGPATRRFALVGSSVFRSPSPAMHAAAYRAAGIDARYLPLELDRLAEVDPLLGPGGLLGLEGLAVTMPFKEAAARRCAALDGVARRAGAVNTVVVEPGGTWRGANTDGPAVLGLVREHLPPAGARVAIVGAGGTARAAAVVLAQAGAGVTLFNRHRRRAEEAARATGAQSAPLDALPRAAWDVLVQATPLGTGGERVLPAEALDGGRLVIDAVYGPRPTPLVADASARGLAVADGFRLLVAQAVLQFELLAGTRVPSPVFQTAGRAWLQRRREPAPR